MVNVSLRFLPDVLSRADYDIAVPVFIQRGAVRPDQPDFADELGKFKKISVMRRNP